MEGDCGATDKALDSHDEQLARASSITMRGHEQLGLDGGGTVQQRGDLGSRTGSQGPISVSGATTHDAHASEQHTLPR